jgi:putative transposase
LLLRRQLDILERRLGKPVRLSRIEKLTLGVLAAKLKATSRRPTAHLRDAIRLFQPETVLKWHRELMRRKWTHRQPNRGGRPRTSVELETLVVRFVRENPDWGYGKLEGELRKLGYRLSEQTIANILDRHGIPPVPQRKPSVSWRHLMRHYKAQLLACDFFTVDTLFLQTVYVLFFIELQTRRVYLAGCTSVIQPSILGSGEFEAIEVHDFVPRGHKVMYKLLLCIITRIDFRDRAKFGV